MSWRRGTFLIVRPDWCEGGRQGTCLGPDVKINANSVLWTPILWAGEEDPDWYKTRGLLKKAGGLSPKSAILRSET